MNLIVYTFIEYYKIFWIIHFGYLKIIEKLYFNLQGAIPCVLAILGYLFWIINITESNNYVKNNVIGVMNIKNIFEKEKKKSRKVLPGPMLGGLEIEFFRIQLAFRLENEQECEWKTKLVTQLAKFVH